MARERSNNAQKLVACAGQIERVIFLIRGEKIVLDADLASLYGVSTKRLNEQVRRNQKRFPSDFVFQLTDAEKAEVVANCDHLSGLKFSAQLPLAFTDPHILGLVKAIKRRSTARLWHYPGVEWTPTAQILRLCVACSTIHVQSNPRHYILILWYHPSLPHDQRRTVTNA